MKKYFFFLFFIICSASTIFPQSGEAKSLTIGNKWIYKQIYLDTTYIQYEVVGDTIFSNVQYAAIKQSFWGHSLIFFHYERADSSRLYLYNTDDSTEYEIVDFNLEEGDSLGNYEITSKDTILFWNELLPRMCLTVYFPGLFTEEDCYVEGIGLANSESYGSSVGGYATTELEAAYIDGNSYGDTTLLGVKTFKIQNPNDFKLYQNYPNPFNPSTVIRFSVGSPGKVSITVYDVLGNEIAVLVNEEKSTGIYIVNFNGSHLSSGVYFYRMKAGILIQTRKMILLR